MHINMMHNDGKQQEQQVRHNLTKGPTQKEGKHRFMCCL